MPKSRGRKPKKSRVPAAPKERSDTLNTTSQISPLPTQAPHESSSVTPTRQEPPASRIKNIAALMSPVGFALAIVQFAYAFWPSVTIEAGPSLDVSDPLATLIRITNSGRVPVRTVHFSCEILPDRVRMGSNKPGQEPVASLSAGASATRSFAFRAQLTKGSPYGYTGGDPLKMGLNVTAEFTWPLIPLPGHETRHFSVRRDEDGRFILVPDTEK
jgi:hypothetical protein